ncbi:MAG TPA: metallophosphoesterase, partial [Flavobacteriaceae bacterium]|nr:metallophosphoesterase [Flavobacteriaceae bacterium]
PIFHIIYWAFSLIVIVNFIYQLATYGRYKGLSPSVMLAFGLLILSGSLKLIPFFILLGEDIFRLGSTVVSYFITNTEPPFMPERRAVVSKIALAIAAIPFTSVLYGMVKGKYNYQVIKHTLFFDDLPESFDGFTLTQISDVHSGSFDNAEKIDYGINLINEQNSDVILFTGDIVNNMADEMDEWIPYFKRLDAKYGKYSVLGNHDYGEYVRWKTLEEKEQCFEDIKKIHPKIGFNLLLNDSVYLEKGGDKIALVGVENWGTRFRKAGDLDKASEKISKEDFKILMSHDPSHWDAEVKHHPKHFHLTLSGHTHGMQFGIEIPGIKWSPIKYIYKKWAGVYEELGKYINVNRGFGFLAFPGRVGIWPEITVITLKKKQ